MKTTGLKTIDETINPAEPTKEKLAEWAEMTESNCHIERMVEVANWAEVNARKGSTGIIPVFKVIREELEDVAAIQEADGHLTWENGQRRSKLDTILRAAIRAEYGDDTAAMIDHN